MKKKIFIFSFLSLTIFFAGCSATLTPQERIRNFELVKKGLIEQGKYKEAQKIQETIDKIKRENGIPVDNAEAETTTENKKENTAKPAAEIKKSAVKNTPSVSNTNKTIVKVKKTGNKKNAKKVKQKTQKTASNKTGSEQKPKKQQTLFKVYSVETKSLKFKELKDNNKQKFDILNEIKR